MIGGGMAQTPSYYMGRRNLLKIGTEFYYQDIAGESYKSDVMRGSKQNILSLYAGLERLVGMKRSVGLTLGMNRYMLFDKPELFDSEPYEISVNGQPQTVKYGNGRIFISESTTFVYLKRYLKKQRPFGYFICWKAGLSNYNVNVEDAYMFRYFYDQESYRDYKPAKHKVASYKHLILGFELGRSMRVWHDRFLFSYSVTLPMMFTVTGKKDTLSRRFVKKVDEYITGYKPTILHLGFSYVL
jgi:hypothetical protein